MTGLFAILGRYLIMGCLCFPVLILSSCQDPSFNEVADQMAGNEVPCVFPESLPPNAVLLDAREKEEFDMSHLEGAIHVGYEDAHLNVVSDFPDDTAMVVYCAVGYRSERIAKRLRREGFTRVYNLWGGIFNWYNKGYVVYDAHGPTRNIHPYNNKWGKWLVNHE
jgi:rhodanese-related sulfurtransferase